MKGESDRRGAFEYEISVIILTYHPDWDKLRQTICSAVFQEGVRLQIVVADDGSPDNCRERMEALFSKLGFSDYKLVLNPENHGTIANFISGLEAARGEYAKCISPGDFLTGSDVLKGWLDFTRREGYDWTFSDALYYRNAPDGMQLLPTPPFPVYLNCYHRKNAQRCRWNYAVLDDAALGATLLGRTATKLRYARELAGIGNLYCEDYIYRMMMYDGVCGGYYPRETVFYEYGTGISSGGNSKWQQRITDEFLAMSRLLMARENPDPFQQRMQRQIRKKTSMRAMVRIPGKITRALLFKLVRRKARIDFAATEPWRRRCG